MLSAFFLERSRTTDRLRFNFSAIFLQAHSAGMDQMYLYAIWCVRVRIVARETHMHRSYIQISIGDRFLVVKLKCMYKRENRHLIAMHTQSVVSARAHPLIERLKFN